MQNRKSKKSKKKDKAKRRNQRRASPDSSQTKNNQPKGGTVSKREKAIKKTEKEQNPQNDETSPYPKTITTFKQQTLRFKVKNITQSKKISPYKSKATTRSQ